MVSSKGECHPFIYPFIHPSLCPAAKLLCIVLHRLYFSLSPGPVIKIAWYTSHVDYLCNLCKCDSFSPVWQDENILSFTRLQFVVSPQYSNTRKKKSTKLDPVFKYHMQLFILQFITMFKITTFTKRMASKIVQLVKKDNSVPGRQVSSEYQTLHIFDTRSVSPVHCFWQYSTSSLPCD